MVMHESKGGSLLSTIMDFGKELVVAGEEIWRVENTLLDLCDAYAFKKYDVWVVSSCIEATVQTNDGRVYTQIRSINGRNFDVERLSRLESLSEEVITRRMGAAAFRERVQEILDIPEKPRYFKYLGSVVAATGFTAFFDGDPADVALAAVIGLILATLSDTIGRRESNPLVYNSIAAFIMELVLIAAVSHGFGHHADIIASAALLLLISGLGLTNGIKDILHKNTLSGLNDVLVSLLGASGIAIGISLVLYFSRNTVLHLTAPEETVESVAMMIASCTFGCIGFALLFGARGRIIALTAVGAALTWSIDLLVKGLLDGNYFAATLAAACFAAFFSNAIGKITRIPATAFLMTAVFPLIPGSCMYRTVYAAIMDDSAMLHSQGRQLILICLAISLGYIIIEVLYKYTTIIKRKLFLSGDRKP